MVTPLIEKLNRAFSVSEVENSRRLQAILACLLFYCVLIFRSWAFQPGLYRSAIERLNFMPMWPVEHLPFRPLMPESMHQLIFTLFACTALFMAVSVFLGKHVRPAFWSLVVLTNIEILYYLHDLRQAANFFHVHLYLTFFFVLSRQKLIFSRLALWLVYWLAALVKLTPSWLWGEYFNSVPAKLPLFPTNDSAVTAASVLLLVVELTAPLLWFSKSAAVRHASAAILILFHIYSGVIVGHWYTTLMFPVVMIMLVPFEAPVLEGLKIKLREKLLFFCLALFLFGGLFNYLVPGDVRTTAEGRYHGLFMFDANRRAVCQMNVKLNGDWHYFYIQYDWPRAEVLDWSTNIQYAASDMKYRPMRKSLRVDGKVLFNPEYFRRNSSRIFSDPYVFYYYLKRIWERFHPEKVRLILDHQLDGHSHEFRILDLDESTIGALEYTGFGRNPWIQVPGPETPRAYQWP